MVKKNLNDTFKFYVEDFDNIRKLQDSDDIKISDGNIVVGKNKYNILFTNQF